MKGGGIGGKGRGGEKGVRRGKEGLAGEDFPGKFGKPPDRQIRQGPPSPKTRDRHPFGGRSPTPSLPLAYAHTCGVAAFFKFILYSL